MSRWVQKEKEDLDLSEDKTELYIFCSSDDFGNNYTYIKIKDVIEFLKEKEIIK